MAKIVKALFALKPITTNVVVRFFIGVPLLIGVLQLGEYYQHIGYVVTEKILTTLSIIIAYYFIILSVLDGITNRVYSFQEEKNSANLHRNPLKFAFKHRNKIIIFYKAFFIINIVYILIVVWLFD